MFFSLPSAAAQSVGAFLTTVLTRLRAGVPPNIVQSFLPPPRAESKITGATAAGGAGAAGPRPVGRVARPNKLKTTVPSRTVPQRQQGNMRATPSLAVGLRS